MYVSLSVCDWCDHLAVRSAHHLTFIYNQFKWHPKCFFLLLLLLSIGWRWHHLAAFSRFEPSIESETTFNSLFNRNGISVTRKVMRKRKKEREGGRKRRQVRFLVATAKQKFSLSLWFFETIYLSFDNITWIWRIEWTQPTACVQRQQQHNSDMWAKCMYAQIANATINPLPFPLKSGNRSCPSILNCD